MRGIKFRAVMPEEKAKELGFKLFYQNEQYLGSFLRRANMFAFSSSGHDKYGVPELEQFTGLRDKNGKEIYEGDIVKFKDGFVENEETGEFVDDWHTVTVVFGAGEFYGQKKDGERWDNGHSYEDFDNDIPFSECEVIGNVHESPELLNP